MGNWGYNPYKWSYTVNSFSVGVFVKIPIHAHTSHDIFYYTEDTNQHITYPPHRPHPIIPLATLPETNIAPEHGWLENHSPFRAR